MIQIKEEKIAKMMFDIWQKSNDLKNPVMVSDYIGKETHKVKNLSLSGVSKRFNRRSFIVGIGCGMAMGLSIALIILNVF